MTNNRLSEPHDDFHSKLDSVVTVVGEDLLKTFPGFLGYLHEIGVGVEPDSYDWARTYGAI